MILKEALTLIGGLSSPSKMPCHGYSISARLCKVGAKLREVADSVCSKCYAIKGRYNYPNVANAMARRVESINHPQWAEAMAIAIGGTEASGYFRWHDSGDLQSVEHLAKICKVAELLPTFKFWLPTREYGMVQDYIKAGNAIPRNLTVRLSAFMIDGPLPLALAAKLGCQVSGVATKEFNCPAPQQGNKCLTCRACWDKVGPVIYQKH